MEKILIIEDEKVLADVLQAKLEKEGYEVAVAYDGEDGYAKVGKTKPDLILLDIVMPKMNGYEVLEKLYEDKNTVPIIIISNSGQPVEIEKTRKLGAVDHLVKADFDPEEVIVKIRNFLGKEKTLEELSEPPSEEDSQSESSEKKADQGTKVLLVEDDKFLRSICGQKLEKEGFSVFEAIDGERALESVEKVRPDIVLLDVVLPTLDGFQVLKAIRENSNKAVAQTPIIILSNLGQDEDLKKAKEFGANDFMVKANFTTQQIIEKIKETLGK